MEIANKIDILRSKLTTSPSEYSIMIIGLGSVGLYLLDYLVSKGDYRMKIITVGRNYDKMLSDVNIVRTAATIRGQYKCKIEIDSSCDLENVESIAGVINRHNPDFIVNTSRAYPGLKYGSISWDRLRAYGIWTPLSIKFARNIMLAYKKANSNAITINTSYSDAVIPWLKSAGLEFFDFGSGNLNHLIPRMKFYVSKQFGIDDLNKIDITLAVSHFHDVVISKEGHSEGQEILVSVKYKGELLDIDKVKMLNACKISMPVDQKRNMMNASSNYAIIDSIINAIDNKSIIKIHTPGVDGNIGGYPYVIDCSEEKTKAAIDQSVFSIAQMRSSNLESINKDGIENVLDGVLIYTDELISKIKQVFGVDIPKNVHFSEIDAVAEFLINYVIQR